jgi:hypothetical protein
MPGHPARTEPASPLELALEGNFSANIFRCGPSHPLRDEKNSMLSNVPSVSGMEEREPEHAQDQNREAGGGYEQGEHRGARLGLPRLGRGFDDLTLLSRCHAGLDFLDVAGVLDAMSRQRRISDDVPGLAAL